MWVAALALVAGCQKLCVGAGCEENFGAATLTVFSGSALPAAGSIEPELGTALVTGTEADGPIWAVTATGDRILVGSSIGSSVRSFSSQDPSQTTSDADGIIRGETNRDAFGHQVATFTDYDGDQALLVAAPLYSVSAASRDDGSIHQFSGKGTGFNGSFSALDASFRVNGVESGARFGSTVAVCPDLDGDGGDEWFVGASRSSEGSEMAGSATLILSTERLEVDVQTGSGAFEKRWYGEAVGARAGHALACSNDLDGDGTADLVIGAPFTDGPDGTDAVGAVYVLSGTDLDSSGPLAGAATRVLYGIEANEWMGYSVAIGDVDGDGLADLVAGAPGSDEASGAVHIWLGAQPIAGEPTTTLRGDTAGDGFGHAVSVGDLNADGIDDLVVGAPYLNPSTDEETFDAGALFLYFGKSSWTGLADRIYDASIGGTEQYQRTGRSILVADLTGDGHADIASVQRTAPE